MERSTIDEQTGRSRNRGPGFVNGTFGLAVFWAATVSVASAEQAPGEYRLASGDRLSIVIFGHTDLSGEFMVDGSGRILLPIAGPVMIGELTVPEAQDRIQMSFADGVLAHPVVAVRVVEQRPIYIIGDVRLPGTFPFRFGQSVTAAIAMSGGLGRAADQQNAMFDFVVAEERVRTLEVTQRSLLLRKARLEAQLDDAQEFARPQLSGVQREDRGMDAQWEGEREIFATLTQAHNRQVAALRQQPARLEVEITALTEQVAKERENLGLAKLRVAEAEPLSRTGVIQRNVLIDRQREEVRIESQILNLTAQIARIAQAIGDINIRIEDAQALYRRQIVGDLQDTLQRVRELEVTLASARELRELRAQYAGGIEGVEPAHAITVTRTRMTGATTFLANGETVLEPGDVIEVKRKRKQPPTQVLTDWGAALPFAMPAR